MSAADLVLSLTVSVAGCALAGWLGVRVDAWLQRRGWGVEPAREPAPSPVLASAADGEVWVPAQRVTTRAPAGSVSRAAG